MNPEAIDLIIAKKAEEFTDTDIDALIKHFRKERANFAVTEATKTRVTKPKPVVDPALSALLDDV